MTTRSYKTRETRTDKQLLIALVTLGGSYQSLCKLADWLGIDYSHAHETARKLERLGLLKISKPGRDLVLQLADGLIGYQED